MILMGTFIILEMLRIYVLAAGILAVIELSLYYHLESDYTHPFPGV